MTHGRADSQHRVLEAHTGSLEEKAQQGFINRAFFFPFSPSLCSFLFAAGLQESWHATLRSGPLHILHFQRPYVAVAVVTLEEDF